MDFRRYYIYCSLWLMGTVIFLFTYYEINVSTQVINWRQSWSFRNSSNIFRSIPDSSISNVASIFTHNTPAEAFVVFSNNNKPKYLALLNNLLGSIHYFSTRSVIVYGIDIDLALSNKKYPRLIKRRLISKDCGPSIYFCKIYAMVTSQVQYGVQLDVDSVVNWNIDILFDVVHRWPYPLPLAPRHPNDPMNYRRFLNKFNLRVADRTTPYIHAQFSWNYRSYPFLRRALALMRKNNFIGANYDETAMNVLLWQAQANHTLCRIDPYFTYISEYENQIRTCQNDCHKVFVIFHGGKNSYEMRNVFQRLKHFVGFPYVQTKHDGMHYLNETQYTCCYPDSRPSPIHPLLCEYPKRTKQ